MEIVIGSFVGGFVGSIVASLLVFSWGYVLDKIEAYQQLVRRFAYLSF